MPASIGGYKVNDILGRGGFGEVRVGEQPLTGERVALKFLRKSEIHSLGAAERTNTEIQCLTALKHNNIIRLMQHLESANHVVLVFELMEGGDLLKHLTRREAPMGGGGGGTGEPGNIFRRHTLSEDEAKHTFYQILCGIRYAVTHNT
jgi:serine/threonine protein kinase